MDRRSCTRPHLQLHLQLQLWLGDVSMHLSGRSIVLYLRTTAVGRYARARVWTTSGPRDEDPGRRAPMKPSSSTKMQPFLVLGSLVLVAPPKTKRNLGTTV